MHNIAHDREVAATIFCGSIFRKDQLIDLVRPAIDAVTVPNDAISQRESITMRLSLRPHWTMPPTNVDVT
jgi:hypothetical protein